MVSIQKSLHCSPQDLIPSGQRLLLSKKVPGVGTGWGKLCSTSAKHTAICSHLHTSAALTGSRRERDRDEEHSGLKGPTCFWLCMFRCIPKERKLDLNLSTLIATALPPGGWMQTRRGCFSLLHFGKTAFIRLRSKLLDLCLHMSHLPRNEEWRQRPKSYRTMMLAM